MTHNVTIMRGVPPHRRHASWSRAFANAWYIVRFEVGGAPGPDRASTLPLRSGRSGSANVRFAPCPSTIPDTLPCLQHHPVSSPCFFACALPRRPDASGVYLRCLCSLATLCSLHVPPGRRQRPHALSFTNTAEPSPRHHSQKSQNCLPSRWRERRRRRRRRRDRHREGVNTRRRAVIAVERALVHTHIRIDVIRLAILEHRVAAAVL